MNSFYSTSAIVGLVAGIAAVAAQPAYSVTLRYEIEGIAQAANPADNTDFKAVFEYVEGEEAIESFGGGFFQGFDVKSFSIELTGGILDGLSLSSQAGDDVQFLQFETFVKNGQFFFGNQSDDPSQVVLFFQSFFAVNDEAGALDLDAPIFGQAYIGSNLVASSFIITSATETPIAPVPLPASGAALALATGGLALRNAAKKRRAEKRAKALV